MYIKCCEETLKVLICKQTHAGSHLCSGWTQCSLARLGLHQSRNVKLDVRMIKGYSPRNFASCVSS